MEFPPSFKRIEGDIEEILDCCVISLGSMGRGMLSAYSDMEYAVLLPNMSDAEWEKQDWTPGQEKAKARADYFRNFI